MKHYSVSLSFRLSFSAGLTQKLMQHTSEIGSEKKQIHKWGSMA